MFSPLSSGDISMTLILLLWSSMIMMMVVIKPIHSMGTLLHAGPSCIIKPHQQQQQQQQRLMHTNAMEGGTTLLFDNQPVKHRGICYSTLLCKQKGGVAIGRCGLGNSCCVFPQTCDSISVRNSTYFTSPEYPSLMNRTLVVGLNSNSNYYSDSYSDSNQQQANNDETEYSVNSLSLNNFGQKYKNSINNLPCSLTIHRMPGIHQICKIRLDFIEYEIEGHRSSSTTTTTTTTNKETLSIDNNININNDNDDNNDHNQNTKDIGQVFECDNPDDKNSLDWITIKPMYNDVWQTEPIIPAICPISKIGQHVMVDVRKHVGPFLLSVNTGSWPGRRRWNILINQIECNPKRSSSSSSLLTLFPKLDRSAGSNVIDT